MSCSFTEKISSLIDGELAAAEAREVERHLLTCGECEQLRADFLNLRSQIAGFETLQNPAVSNRALKKILSREDRVPATGLRWAWSMPAIAFAALIVVAVILGLIVYQRPSNTDSHKNEVASAPSPEPSPTIENKNQPVPEQKPAERPKKPLAREPKPGEQFAIVTEPAVPTSTPERVQSADTETLTAIHFEKSENLLRSFRNVRLNTPDAAAEVAYERKRAQQLVYQNMILRRQADADGNVQVASLLENLEPILLDIANLPNKPDSNAVRTIRERVERKNIVPLLQVNSAALARALD